MLHSCTFQRNFLYFPLYGGIYRLKFCFASSFLNFCRWMYADIFADRAAIFTPVCIPVRSMPRPIFTFMTPLLPTTCKLLPIGDFTIHEVIPLPLRRSLRHR